MENREIPDGDASLLARMMDLEEQRQGLWDPEDLGPILEHQLAAPLESDLADLRPGLRRRLAEVNSAGGGPIASFRDLLVHSHPPLDLLELTKQFAKNCRSNPEGPLPEDVATILYLAAITAARVRCEERITRLGDEGMQHGLRWALRQSWVDELIRRLLEEGVAAFGGSTADPQ